MKTRKFNNSWLAKCAGCAMMLVVVFGYHNSMAQQKSKGNEVFTSVEHTPEFPGGMEAFYQYIASKIKYPAKARKENISGRVIVTFIVEKDGSLSDVKAVRSPDKSLADEAVKVLATSPKWKPGIQNNQKVRVQYTVPVQFTLAGNGNKSPRVKDTKAALSGTDKNTYYVINGKPASAEKLNTISTKNIKTVNVLKGKDATNKYGTKGARSVVEVLTK